MKAGDQYINVGLSVGLDWTSEVAKINTGNAQTLTEAELMQKQNTFMTGLMNTPIGMLFQTMGGDNSGGINDYYEITTDDMNNTDDVIISDNVEDDEAIVGDGEDHIN